MKAGLRDGEGKYEQLDVTGSLFGLNEALATSGTFDRLADDNGAVFSIVRQSGTAPTYGARINFGSCTTTSAGLGSAIFNTAFASTQYFFTAQPGSTSIAAWEERISGLVIISGNTAKNVSGVIFWGAASTPYTWVAIGI